MSSSADPSSFGITRRGGDDIERLTAPSEGWWEEGPAFGGGETSLCIRLWRLDGGEELNL